MDTPTCPICDSRSDEYSQYRTCAHRDLEDINYQVWRCQECFLLFVNPLPDLSLIEGQYDMEEVVEHIRRGSYLGRKIRYGWRALKLRSSGMSGSLIEIGCGQGDFLIGAKFAGFSPIVGVEPEKATARFAANRGFTVHDNLFNPANFEKEQFDNAVSIQVLEHVPDPIKFVKDISLVIKKGGRLLLETPCTSHPRALKAGKEWRYISPPWHLNLFNEKNLAILFERAGLKLEKTWQHTHKAYISAIGVKL